MMSQTTLHSRNWLGKASAGLVLGYLLALGVSGFVSLGAPGGPAGGKVQFVMWTVSPVWACVLSFCFLFRDGLRAWLWLGGATILTYGLLVGGRYLLG